MDVSYTIHPDTLREIPNDPEAMRYALVHYQHKANQIALDIHEQIEAMGMAGSLARILGELDLACTLLTHAVDMAETHRLNRMAFVNRIRLAHTYQWMQKFDQSTAMFNALLKSPIEGYHDFLLQHAGKNAYDQGDYSQALTHFREALSQREHKGNMELIESTRTAIRAVERRLSPR